MLRFLYNCMLRLHPSGFRKRFAAEMLSIFDQAGGKSAEFKLLVDAILSLTRQWTLRTEFWYDIPPTQQSVPDNIPLFHTLDPFRPRTAAVIQGLLLSTAIFCATCFAIRYSWIHLLHVRIPEVQLESPHETFDTSQPMQRDVAANAAAALSISSSSESETGITRLAKSQSTVHQPMPAAAIGRMGNQSDTFQDRVIQKSLIQKSAIQQGIAIPPTLLSGSQHGTSPLTGTSPAANSSATACLAPCLPVYEISPNGSSATETILYNFAGSPNDGSGPLAGLVADASGNLYGTTQSGGLDNGGIIFELNPTSGTETLLYNFTGQIFPTSTLVLDPSGNLYGATTGGGVRNSGLVYKLNGTTFTTLYGGFGSGGVGFFPSNNGSLAMDSSGNLYGTVTSGGAHGKGQVFKLTPSGTETTLYNFAGGAADGCFPQGAPVFGPDGNLYGMASACGGSNWGTIWKLTLSGTETVLYNFNGTDGASPLSSLVFDNAGNMYGVTANGGNASGFNGNGVLFELTPSGTYTILHIFNSATDGAQPQSSLLLSPDGNLYGTAPNGGADGYGTVWAYPAYNSLTVTLAGTGTGTVTSSPAGINCPGTCSALFLAGTDVTLTETPASGSIFGGWGGACSGSVCAVTMSSATSVTAAFTKNSEQATSTTLSSSVNPSTFGQNVMFTATVSAQSGTPTGSVTFFNGTTALGTQTLSSGSAVFSTSSCRRTLIRSRLFTAATQPTRGALQHH